MRLGSPKRMTLAVPAFQRGRALQLGLPHLTKLAKAATIWREISLSVSVKGRQLFCSVPKA